MGRERRINKNEEHAILRDARIALENGRHVLENMSCNAELRQATLPDERMDEERAVQPTTNNKQLSSQFPNLSHPVFSSSSDNYNNSNNNDGVRFSPKTKQTACRR